MKLELKHLAPYMPYGLRVHYSGLTDDDVSGEFNVISYYAGNGVSLIDDDALEEGDLSKSFYVDYDFPIRPILRPIMSISAEEMLELVNIAIDNSYYKATTIHPDDMFEYGGVLSVFYEVDMYDVNFKIDTSTGGVSLCYIDYGGHEEVAEVRYAAYEWLFKNHFDVFGLIDKGLAEEKTL